MHLLEYRVKDSARRTLEVTKLFDLDRRIRWSKHVRRISSGHALNDRRFSAAAPRVNPASSVFAIPKATGFPSVGEAGMVRVKVPGAAERDAENDEDDDER
jgi:hypothetical protein